MSKTVKNQDRSYSESWHKFTRYYADNRIIKKNTDPIDHSYHTIKHDVIKPNIHEINMKQKSNYSNYFNKYISYYGERGIKKHNRIEKDELINKCQSKDDNVIKNSEFKFEIKGFIWFYLCLEADSEK